jgi:hypothetical protein
MNHSSSITYDSDTGVHHMHPHFLPCKNISLIKVLWDILESLQSKTVNKFRFLWFSTCNASVVEQPILRIWRIWDQSCNCMTISLQPILWICRIWDQKCKCFWKYKFLGNCSLNSFQLLTYLEQVFFFFSILWCCASVVDHWEVYI